MKCLMLLLSALAGMMLSSALPVNDDTFDPLANATIVDLKWTVPISPGRTDTVFGTIEDVARHLSVVDPKRFAANQDSIYDGVTASPPDHPAVSDSTKDDQDGLYDVGRAVCRLYDDAKGNTIMTGIEHLRALVGPASLPANACGRVSCSWDSAIWWCNMSDRFLTLDSFGRIADGAQDLMNSCAFIQDEKHIGPFSGNQAFGYEHVNKWCTVVRKNHPC
ncbi:hypothetical protein KVR01_008349 [Diaporthe batatas]|uniref:uncharacterized protein n=1 Tax=Diaporthe batatas TaxID=748121 RepID=UPI001D0412C4|nr:uncharacterized protein KVR01_008349 [Diaporthe batatas]KAG8162584.1 hypothetical protein KVR01_008349 [Diaporthe batatas]